MTLSAFSSTGSSSSGDKDPRQEFLRDWIDRNHGELLIAFRLLGNTIAKTRGMDAESATSDLLVEVSLIALSQAYRNYDLASYPSPRLWLLKIAHIVSHRWKTARSVALARTVEWDGLDAGLHGNSQFSSGTDPAQTVPNRLWIQAHLASLSPEDRELVILRDEEQRSFGDIAARFGVTEGAVRVRHHRIIKRLQQNENNDAQSKIQTNDSIDRKSTLRP